MIWNEDVGMARPWLLWSILGHIGGTKQDADEVGVCRRARAEHFLDLGFVRSAEGFSCVFL